MLYVILGFLIFFIALSLGSVMWIVHSKSELKSKFKAGTVAIASIGCSIFFYNAYQKAIDVENCGNNLRYIGAAVDLYQSNYEHYPRNLEVLMPNGFDELPLCPLAEAGDKQGYRRGYQVSDDDYTIMCSGHHHAGFGGTAENFPQYSGSKGLLLH